MHFGRDIGKDRFIGLFQRAYELGIRTFVTADVYGAGEADRLLGEALAGCDRASWCLVGAVGHDFYKGTRQGEKGFPRFTDPSLRGEGEFAGYLRMAAEKSLERIGTDYFDLLLLHNPDSTGYSSEAVWEGMAELMEQGSTRLLGIAPGPANGFTLDLIDSFERFGSLIDWAMIILNPLEPWPGKLALPAAEQSGVRVMARVLDHGGLFLDSLRAGDAIARDDHRAFRPAGWVEAAQEKLARMRQAAEEAGMSLLQFAAQWALAQPAVECVIPTLIQEAAPHAKPLETFAEELAALHGCRPLPRPVVEETTRLGDNRGCMPLKGASPQYLGPPQADQWQLTDGLREVAARWNIVPDRDLYCPTDPRDIREIGAPKGGVVQAMNRRLYVQLHAFGNCADTTEAARALAASAMDSVLYRDFHDPSGIAVLLMSEDAEALLAKTRAILGAEPFSRLVRKPGLTMAGRTYSAGREPDLEETLLMRPRAHALNPAWPWAIWYPLRRKPEFELLPRAEQGGILMEHATIGRTYGQCDYAHDIRLACHGLDSNDNEFVLGIVGKDLHPLSRLVQEMRKSRQTAKYIQSLGPFFVGFACWQSPPPAQNP
jgi:aryl-alcohol dehydrogenase-like predicted oxidoreductase/chlorite dismutase